LKVAANAMVFESQTRGDQIWASRNEYTLRREGDEPAHGLQESDAGQQRHGPVLHGLPDLRRPMQ
jgi:hypothetical protein